MNAGIIGKHVAETNGTKGNDKAAKKATELWNTTQERLSTIIDDLGGDNGFKTLAAVQQFSGLVDLLETGGLPDTTSSTEIVPANRADVQVASSSSSDAEMLGNSLLRVFGGDSNRAGLGIKFVSNVLASGEDSLDYFQSVLFALNRDTNPDEIVNEGGRFTLRSQQSLRDRKNELESALYDLVKAVYDGRSFPVTLSPGDLVDEAKKVLARKAVPAPVATPPAPVSQDAKYLETLARISKIKAASSTTPFEQHLLVVLDAYGKPGREFIRELERVSKIRHSGESIQDFVDNVVKALRTTTTPTSSRELDAIGTKLGHGRIRDEKDADYSARLVKVITDKLARITTLEGDVRKAEADRKQAEEDLKKVTKVQTEDDKLADAIINANNVGDRSRFNALTPASKVAAVILAKRKSTNKLAQKGRLMDEIVLPATTA